MSLLCFCPFSELLEAVLGDFLLSSRCDGMSLTKLKIRKREFKFANRHSREVPIEMPAKTRFNP